MSREKVPGRPVGNPAWVPGGTGGRRKGFKSLAALIRQETGDGQALVEFAMAVFRGDPDPHTNQVPTLAQRMEAHEWLTDRGFGKAVTPIDLMTDGKHEALAPMHQFSERELLALESALSVIEKAAKAPIDVDG